MMIARSRPTTVALQTMRWLPKVLLSLFMSLRMQTAIRYMESLSGIVRFSSLQIFFPNCLLELTNGSSYLWVTNFARENLLLPHDTYIASFTVTIQSGINDVDNVCLISETSSLVPDSSSVVFAQVVFSDFAPSKSRRLQDLLSE